MAEALPIESSIKSIVDNESYSSLSICRSLGDKFFWRSECCIEWINAIFLAILSKIWLTDWSIWQATQIDRVHIFGFECVILAIGIQKILSRRLYIFKYMYSIHNGEHSRYLLVLFEYAWVYERGRVGQRFFFGGKWALAS